MNLREGERVEKVFMGKCRPFPLSPYDRSIYVEYRGTMLWAVTLDGSSCWSKDRQFVYEPLPSSRSLDFYEKCRFPFDEAVGIARSLVDGQLFVDDSDHD